MTFLRSATLTSAFALMAGPALAQVAAGDVWADWKEVLENYGIDVATANETSSGGTTIVSGLSLGFEMPEGAFSIALGSVTFEDQPNVQTNGFSTSGTWDLNDPLVMNVTDEDGEDATIRMTLTQPGAEILVSGAPDAMRYDFNYPEISVSEFDVDGTDIPEDFPAMIEVTARDMTGYMAMQDSELRAYDSVVSLASLVADIAVDVPEDEGGGSFAMTFDLADLQQTTTGTFGVIDMAMSAAEMIGGGMRQDSRATHGPARYTIEADGPDGAFRMEAEAASGSLDMSIDEQGISYGTSTSDTTVSITGDAIPLPAVNLSIAESGGTFSMPLVPGEAPQDFGVVLRLVGLEVDDMIWGLFDPAGQLPRDPATLIVDLGGTAILTDDFTDPDYAEDPSAAMPGTVEELKINALQLTLAGAELTGTGDFAFDNSMGMPMPSGQADLMLSGGNTLLDTLVGMGLLPEEQAMGARMMLGMFARPGPGEDTLTSQIEVTPDGQVLANGQRIR